MVWWETHLGCAAGPWNKVDLHWPVGHNLNALRRAREAKEVLPHGEARRVLCIPTHPS